MREVFFYFRKVVTFVNSILKQGKKPDLFTPSGDHLQSPARALSSPIILGVRTARPSNRNIAHQYKNTGIVSGSMEKEYRDGDLSKTRSKANGAAQEENKAKTEEENREQTREDSKKASNSTNSVTFEVEVPQKNESLEGSRERSGSNGGAKSPGSSNGSSKKVVVVRSAPITIGKVVVAANFINFALFSNRERTFAQITLRDFVQMAQNAFAQMKFFFCSDREKTRGLASFSPGGSTNP